MTEEEMEVAFNNGDLNDEQMDLYLTGQDVEATGDTAIPAEEDSPTLNADEEVKTVMDPEAKTEPEPEPEQVVLTKDGKHTIPYSELESARTEARERADEIAVLSAKLTDQAEVLTKMQEAQEQDEITGTTEATDDLMSDLAEDYPGAVKLIGDLQAQIQTLVDKDQQVEAKTAATTAQQDYEGEIIKLNEDFATVKTDDNFWTWFNDQPSYVKAAQSSGDPQQVADVVKLYTDSQTKTPVSDKAKAITDAVKKAEARASGKSSVQTLSDIPGSTSPAADTMEAFHRLPESQQLDKLMAMEETERNKFMNQIV